MKTIQPLHQCDADTGAIYYHNLCEYVGVSQKRGEVYSAWQLHLFTFRYLLKGFKEQFPF